MKKSLLTWMLSLMVALVASPTMAQPIPEKDLPTGTLPPTQLVKCQVEEVQWKGSWTPMVPPDLREGFLVHPTRYREMRTLLTRVLPETEDRLALCLVKQRESLSREGELQLQLTKQAAAPETPSKRWAWTLAGVASGLALGFLAGLLAPSAQ